MARPTIRSPSACNSRMARCSRSGNTGRTWSSYRLQRRIDQVVIAIFDRILAELSPAIVRRIEPGVPTDGERFMQRFDVIPDERLPIERDGVGTVLPRAEHVAPQGLFPCGEVGIQC